MKTYTPEEIKAVVINAGTRVIRVDACPDCGINLAYRINDGNLYFDDSCHCPHEHFGRNGELMVLTQQLPQVEWSALSDYYNGQTDPVSITELDVKLVAGLGHPHD